MLTNAYGFPVLESSDFASPAAMANLASAADAALAAQDQVIDYLERPEVTVLKLPANQGVGSGTTTINFDSIVYQSRTGSSAFGGFIFSGDVWRPGIYHAGAYCQALTSGTVNSVTMDLVLFDKRGFKLLNSYQERERESEGNTPRGAVDLCVERMFEIRKTSGTFLTVEMATIGGGSITVTSGPSRLWIRRVRGF
jgi:hypothetical protein